MRYTILFLVFAFCGNLLSQNTSKFPSLANEKWWGGFVALGARMPFDSNTEIYNLATQNFNNQNVPLLLSSEGRYIWSDQPFSFQMVNDTVVVYSNYEKPEIVVAGKIFERLI